MAALAQFFGLRLAILAGVALQLDIEPVGKDCFQPLHQLFGRRTLPLAQQPPHRPIWPTAQANHIARVCRQVLQRHIGQLAALTQIEAGVQLHQVLIACLALRQ